jgi:peptidoglycan/xylan/chitin deacetylase (PgdA/CDA1 family)
MIGPILSAIGLAAVSAGYQSMAPTAQWYGPTFTGKTTPTGKSAPEASLALTYDDGPNDPHTLRLLEVLAKEDVKATFFLIGRFVWKRPDIVREIARAGHAIGNHTFTHPNLIFASAEQTRLELQQCQNAIADATGELPRLFRPPFGGRRPSTLRVARALGLEPVMWNITGWDWNAPPATEIARGLNRKLVAIAPMAEDYYGEKIRQRKMRSGVILLHDGGHISLGADRSQTVLATQGCIPYWKAAGYKLVTIQEMMGAQRGRQAHKD